MKQFLKMMLAVICGLFLASILSSVFLLGCAGAMAGSGKPVLPRTGVLKMDLSKVSFSEQVSQTPDFRSALQGGEMITPLSLRETIDAIAKAADDPTVQFIYLKPDGAAISISQAEELRQALVRFRESGKAVIAYTDGPSTGAYYLASAADKVMMSAGSGASPMITGTSSQMFFLKDLLDRFGVNVQLIRHGKYKSAGEMFIRNAPSPENLEQNRAMITSIWDTMAAAIAESRGISAGRLTEMVDNLELTDGASMVANSLVDELVTREQLRQRLATIAMADKFEDVKMIALADYVTARTPAPNPSAKKKVAIIYADGEIIEGDGKQEIAGDHFASVIAKVRADSTIQGVVLRVSSPGGSVLAADKIKAELDLLKKDKPLVASYGDYAASGGYWISNNCDKIFSDAMTLTGSIGVFSMIPDFSRTAKDILHVGVTVVGSNKHSDMFSAMRPLDEAEKAYMQASIEDIYGRFVATVSEGRGLEPDFVDSIAQGRVWTGAEALGINLVDEIGSLDDALTYLAGLLGEDKQTWTVETYPKPLTPMEQVLEMFGQNNSDQNDVLAGTPFHGIQKAFRNWDYRSSEHFFARMPYQFVIE